MLSREICLLASQIAKGGTGMVALAGQMLNLVLEDLKLNKDLKVNRVTATLTLQAGTNGPFPLPVDYLRTYDMFYPLQGPNGMTQFLTPITMEQYDEEFKAAQAANYPYEFATDLSTQAIAATTVIVSAGAVGSVTVTNGGAGYTSRPVVAFTGGGGSGATATAQLGVAWMGWDPAPGGDGTGYQVGDVLTVVGGAGSRSAQIFVVQVGGGGQVQGLQVHDPGDYTVLPPTYSTVTGGHGAGLRVAVISATVSSVTVTAGGAGYTSAPAVSFVGGAGSNTAATATLSVGSVTPGKGQLYIYPQSNGLLSVTHRYMRDQPAITNPETSSDTPWFPFSQYLVHQTAALMMGISGDDRQTSFFAQAEAMLRPHLIMEGDEQQTVRSIRLDPRHFHSSRGLRPTKVNPY